MSLAKNNVTISVQVDQKVKEFLVQYSKELDLTLSKFARNLIYVALKNFELLKMTPIAPAIKVFVSTVEAHVTNEKLKEFLIVNKDKKPVTISVVIDSEAKKIMDQYAEYIDLPLNIFARNLVYVGLDYFKILEKVGLLNFSKVSRFFTEGLKGYMKDNRGEENNSS